MLYKEAIAWGVNMQDKKQNVKTDKQVISLFQAGDTNQYGLIASKYQDSLFRTVIRIVKDEAMAEDVVQEALMKAYLKIDMFEGRSSFKSWLFRIAINTAKNKLRGYAKKKQNLDQTLIVVKSQSENKMYFSHVQEKIHELVDALPERQKQAVELRVFSELSFKEIADIMKCPYDTAKANFRHGLLKLKSQITEMNEFDDWKDLGKEIVSIKRVPRFGNA